MTPDVFTFQQFEIHQDKCAMKVGTDAALLGAWAEGGKRILDIGCGTGIISLMMAQRFPDADITGIDIVRECVEQSQENARLTPWANRLHFLNQSLQDYTHPSPLTTHRYDAVVSNPPFFVDSLKNPDRLRTLARHTDSLPLSSLAKGVDSLLSEDGIFSCMLTEECFKQFIDEAWFSNLYLLEDVAIKGKANKPVKRHMLKFCRRRGVEPCVETVILGNADNSRTEWYDNLTKDFYL